MLPIQQMVLEVEAIVLALVESEIKFLSVEGAGHDDDLFVQEGVSRIDIGELKGALFNGRVITRVTSRLQIRYLLPDVITVEKAARNKRDSLVHYHERYDGKVRSLVTGQFCNVAKFELRVKAYYQVIRMLQAHVHGNSKTAHAHRA